MRWSGANIGRYFLNRPAANLGPKGPSPELIAAIVALKTRNPRFGYVRIAQQLSFEFAIELDKDVVRRVLEKHYRPSSPDGGGPSWLTFLAQTKDSLWSTDLFRVESVSLRTHWVMLVMDVFTRRIIGFGVAAGTIDGVDAWRLFLDAMTDHPPPQRLSTDHDPLFRFHRWKAQLRELGISEVKSIPYTPTSHPFVERLIGTLRREYLDHMLFWNTVDLARKLADFRDYYNEARVHRALGGRSPIFRAAEPRDPSPQLSSYRWRAHCGGMFYDSPSVVNANSHPTGGVPTVVGCSIFPKHCKYEFAPHRYLSWQRGGVRSNGWSGAVTPLPKCRLLLGASELEISEVKSIPYTPTSHPFVERIIGTLHREYLDHTLFWNTVDLTRKRADFGDYYNQARVHRAHGGRSPILRATQSRDPLSQLSSYRWRAHCGGMFNIPKAL